MLYTCVALFVRLGFNVAWLIWRDDITGLRGSAHRVSEPALNEAGGQ